MKTKILSHEIKHIFQHEIIGKDGKPNNGISDFEEKLTRIGTKTDEGRRRTLVEVLGIHIHELFHTIDAVTGQDVFTDNDEDIATIKERQLDAFTECLAHILLENDMLNPDWLKKFNRARLR